VYIIIFSRIYTQRREIAVGKREVGERRWRGK